MEAPSLSTSCRLLTVRSTKTPVPALQTMFVNSQGWGSSSVNDHVPADASKVLLEGDDPPRVKFPSVLVNEKAAVLSGCVLSAMVMVPKFGITVMVTSVGAEVAYPSDAV